MKSCEKFHFYFGVVILVLSACSSENLTVRDEVKIQKEVILNQIHSLNPDSSPKYPPFFLAEGTETKNRDAAPDLFELVQRSYERVSPISKGYLQKDGKIRDRETGVEGVLIWFGPVTWQNPDTAEVVCGESFGSYGGKESRFRVRKIGKQWKVLDKTVLWVR